MGRTFIIHTDGGSRNNPGPTAIGVVIEEQGKTVDSFGRFMGERMTNNQAEYLAVEAALIRAKELGGTTIEFYLDSTLVASQLKREFKVKDAELGKIFLRAWNLMQGFSKVTFTAIPREQNKEADRLVNKALDQAGY